MLLTLWEMINEDLIQKNKPESEFDIDYFRNSSTIDFLNRIERCFYYSIYTYQYYNECLTKHDFQSTVIIPLKLINNNTIECNVIFFSKYGKETSRIYYIHSDNSVNNPNYMD